MKTDLFSWLRGTVDIELKGRFSERFLNLAYQENIPLFDVRVENGNIRARVELTAVKRLHSIAIRSHCTFRIRRRTGLPFFMAKMRMRPVLPLMAGVAVLLFMLVSSLIFSLEVDGPYPISDDDAARILALAEESGVAPGRCRWGIDMEAAGNNIMRGFPELTFAEIEEHGVHLVIRVVKRVDPDNEQTIKKPGDLVAICDGIVEDVLVRRGTAAVSPGDAVCAGDILIYGYSGRDPVAANGIVTARMWGKGYGECALREKYDKPTGDIARSFGIRINNGPYLHLAGAAASPYPKYNSSEKLYKTFIWRKTGMVVEILTREYGEIVACREERKQEDALMLARMRAENAARADLLNIFGGGAGAGLQIVSLSTEDIDLDDGLARASSIAEGIAEIGIYRRNPLYDNGSGIPNSGDPGSEELLEEVF